MRNQSLKITIIPPAERWIRTYQPKDAEYYTSPDTDGIKASMTTIQKLENKEFKFRLSLHYWRLFPSDGFKYVLSGKYWFQIGSAFADTFDNIYGEEATTILSDLMKIMITQMIDSFQKDEQHPNKSLFPMLSDENLIRLGQSLPHCVEQ